MNMQVKVDWKKPFKRLLWILAMVLQLLHFSQELQILQRSAHHSKLSQQALFILKQDLTFHCQLLISMGNRCKRSRRSHNKPHSARETT